MRILLTALCCAFLASSAHASGLATNFRAFPPDNCSTSSPFMAFTGADGSNTFCDSGQDIFMNALPGCAANQQVVFNGSKFVCKDAANVPTCPAGQVLTFLSGSGFTCVNGNASVPTCGKNQFLTYSNNTFQCATVSNLTLPVCGKGQVVTSDGTQLTCVDGGAPQQQLASCTAYCIPGQTSPNNGCITGVDIAAAENLRIADPREGWVQTSVPSGTEFVADGGDGAGGEAWAQYQCMNGSWNYINTSSN